MLGSAFRCVRQKPSLKITTRCEPHCSSFGRKALPSAGFTPNVVKYSAETTAARSRSGCSEPVRLKKLLESADRLANDWLRSRKVRKSGGEPPKLSRSREGAVLKTLISRPGSS